MMTPEGTIYPTAPRPLVRAGQGRARYDQGWFGMSVKLRDHLLLTLWLVVTFKQFPMDELILYPLSLYFGYAFLRDIDELFPIVAKSWVLFLFPIWCTLSVLWGVNPSTIIKSAAQGFLTVMICYCVALRLERRDVLVSLVFAAGIFAIASLVLPSTGGKASRGVFASKNSMGLNMVILWTAALCVTFDYGQHRLIRLAAGILAACALALVFISNSATAVLLAFALLLVILLSKILEGRGFLHPSILVILTLGLSFLLIGASLVFSVANIDVIGLVLEEFGKDATLTGRTVLWGYAFEQIKEHPLLGVGHGGFWNPRDWTHVSRKIFVDFHKDFNASFTFHNAYLQTAVHQGLIGLGIAITAFFFSIWQVFAAMIRKCEMPQAFFVAIALMIFARNMTEPGLMTPFALMTMVLYMGALIGVRERVYGAS
ncbi:O-antigen ligase [Celeribacter sp. PS-C1]|uniref:O-antigen ligase family protein n=1 Tax=Celeribacter sp. PS-C1 TaxID=2820813 RepID=UPI001CA590FF|nr:O-antigen ligase family protein [Celeribacter sp. PS-C1]MBW6416919.1 O-antigen ligase family protein [Celeribacter sp. PS-C1]